MGDQLEEAQKQSILQEHGITAEDFASTGLEWSLLDEISKCHSAMNAELQAVGSFVSERLRSVPDVHSLRMRVKACDHLVEKIIRKKIEDPNLSFDLSSYEKAITDLVGVRAIHLFKDQWLAIHHFVTGTWDLHEPAVAYVRTGDPPKLQDAFRDAGLGIKEHPFGYRSVHYVIKANPTKITRLVELQVRTIFEEGWSEIDHLVRYPRKSDDQNLEVFLQIFNRLAGSADEMGTFTNVLDTLLRSHAQNARDKEAEINAVISQLAITREDKASLEKKVTELQRLSQKFTFDPMNIIASNMVITPNFGDVRISSDAMLAPFPSIRINCEKVCGNCGRTFPDTTISIGNSINYCPQCVAARQS